MVRVAFDRAIKTAEKFGFDGPISRWREVRAQIIQDICRNAFDPEMGCFGQSYGSKLLDANLLLVPLVGFLPPTDPRIQGTVRAIGNPKHADFAVRYQTERADDTSAGRGRSLLKSTIYETTLFWAISPAPFLMLLWSHDIEPEPR